jgi:arabinoxylan arabinofuranohydrolase
MKTLRYLLAIQSLLFPAFSSAETVESTAGLEPHRSNPILPGYYADPSVVQQGGKSYIYATLDPWGGETLGCWESSDWKHWTYRVLDWPTKSACKSPTSGNAGVWAPSVVKGPDGKFYMYVSIRNEVWAGVGDSPLGPWKNALGDKPLIDGKFKPGFHMIDAEAFIDDDGTAYLYWGSGINWVNGKCWVVKLKRDMTTFDGEVMDVTPSNYFEGPFMLKHDGKYYLTYSQGKTTEDTYRVHYAIGETPFGPFSEASNSPILVTDKAANVISPGHHTVFIKDGAPYILYHRHSIPFDRRFIGRQSCVQPLLFNADGLIEKIVPSHQAPDFMDRRADWEKSLTRHATATASSSKDRFTGAERVLDDNNATRWAASADAKGGWLQLDFQQTMTISSQLIQPEYAWKSYRFTVEASEDGHSWKTVADFTRDKPASGAPIVIEEKLKARHLRLVFPEEVKGSDISLFEWIVF